MDVSVVCVCVDVGGGGGEITSKQSPGAPFAISPLPLFL